MRRNFIRLLLAAALLHLFHFPSSAETRDQRAGLRLQTRYAVLQIDARGYITSFVSRTNGREYSPPGHPSPLLTLNAGGALFLPSASKIVLNSNELQLDYPNGSRALVHYGATATHLKFRLISLTNRVSVDNIVWGPIHTTLSGKIGDLIGVVRSPDWAIGMLGLDDNTIAGPPSESDFFQMGYYIHSADPVSVAVPAQFTEGQRFGVGGDGKNDVAFFSHPEEYFQFVVGSAAVVEPAFGSTIAYHSRDRRRPYTFLFSLLPEFPDSRPHHQITDPVIADYIGSSVALYACPDEKGLSTIEGIILAEGLPHITRNGKWIRDPVSEVPDIAWYGPHDKLISYANALGLNAVQDESLGEYYPNPADRWAGKRVGFSGGRSTTIKEFADEASKHGILYGLHTLCCFIQPHSSDVHPVPNPHLQTVLRTRLATEVAASDTEMVVTDPSFLAEKGTWHGGQADSVLRIERELLTYTGISAAQPWKLTGVKRAQYGTRASAHPANAEVAKLQMNCYHGFVPDLQLLLEYADYYANLLNDGGMQYIDFDGLESTLYQNQGYYAVRSFFRLLFETYQKLSGGKYLRVMASATFPGGWEYESVGNVGGGTQNFDPVHNRWGIEGKDIRNGYGNSYYPGTFGIQSYSSDWSVYDAENLQAKSIGWDCTYMLGLSEDGVEKSGEKEAIFKSYRLWEDARALNIFTPAAKKQMQDMESKFHLERAGSRFRLFPVKEIQIKEHAGSSSKQMAVANPYSSQPLQLALKFQGAVNGFSITLPDGVELKSDQKIESGQYLMVNGHTAYLTNRFRKKLSEVSIPRAAVLQAGSSKVSIQVHPSAASGGEIPVELTFWAAGKSMTLSARPVGQLVAQ